MKVIFMGVDGVLNSVTTKDTFEGMIGVDTAKIKRLKKIVKATNAVLILYSSWRYSESHVKYLRIKLAKQGLRIIGQTPNCKRDHRGLEIQEWFKQNDDITVESWIVLDDELFNDFYCCTDNEGSKIIEHYLWTGLWNSPDGGLDNDNVKEAIERLNNGNGGKVNGRKETGNKREDRTR